MAGEPTSGTRLRAAEDALRKVQAQAAALEGLSEELSLAVHVLEAEVGALFEQVSSESGARTELARHAVQLGSQAVGGALGADRPVRSSDVEGARLVALNMALDGEPREATDRYVAEHFDIPDRERLLDEVYAAAGR